MKKLFLFALVCATNICMQTHSFQSNTQQLPREVVQELKHKQQENTASQKNSESMPNKTKTALKIAAGAGLLCAGAYATYGTTITIVKKSVHTNAFMYAMAACGITTLYEATQLLLSAYHDNTVDTHN